MKTRQIGRNAETLAAQFLQKNGLKLLSQNFACRYGEIDLIMNDQDDIVFIEVRCRSRIDYGTASDSITSMKMRKLIQTAKFYLQKNDQLYSVSSRFDVISIHFTDGVFEIDWIKNAFLVDI